ncbi:S8 family serine peptidase [Streptomyces sp. NPDC059631]|uniref:S8 family serine peptidase n=1 Tax=unclassified Streptomyces TaxID=2593676 RepID=UPI0036B7452C
MRGLREGAAGGVPGRRGRPYVRRGRPALLVPAAVCALFALSPGPAAAADGDGALPAVSAVPPQGGGCVRPSPRKMTQVPWPQRYIAPSRAWDTTRGEGVTVAVVDTGVDAGHSPALAGRVVAGPDVTTGAAHAAGTDCVGHGTFVAGLIAAAELPGQGFAGVAPRARVLAVRVTDRDGAASADHVAAGIGAAVAGGARIVDVPLALPRGSAALTAAVRDAQRHGALVVAPAYGEADPSASGDPDAPAPAAYPAALDGVLAVASLGPGGAPDQQAAPRTAPDIAAPGTAVMSVGPGGPGHFTGSGADLATGFVAGAAALVGAAHPESTPAQVRARLLATAYPMVTAGRPLVGAGTVDPSAAVSTPMPAGATPEAAAPAPVALAARASHRGRGTAVAVAGGALGAALLTGFAAFTVARARRRGWRPGV